MDGKLMLVDTSYLIFYRYFACRNWFKYNVAENTGENDTNPFVTNPKFMVKYDKMFEQCLKDLTRRYGVSPGNVVFVKDCLRKRIWRHEHIADYKGTREMSRRDNFDYNIFTYTYETLIPRLIEAYGFKQICHPELEADDVAAIITRLVRRTEPVKEIMIITNDNDYVQLVDDPKFVDILNLQSKRLIDRIPLEMTPSLYMLYKKNVGDKSDNISSIALKVGPKTAERLARNPSELQEFFKKKPGAQEMFDRNQLLMNFDKIPEVYVPLIESMYQNLYVQPISCDL